MGNCGIARRVDNLGRIVLPMELRKVLDIPENTPMEIYTEGETIILKKYAPDCLFCGENDNHLVNFKGKWICKKCLKDLKDQNK
jgi:transcriptional pleiotropic regulator of transition state genes